MSFGETERLTPVEARRFIQDLTIHMSKRAHALARDKGCEEVMYQRIDEDGGDNSSPQKQLYGDTWRFLYGITEGIDHMRSGSQRQYLPDEEDVWEIDDSEWQEHYDEYGYGAYGRGLKIGKRFAFYSDTSFDFTAQTDNDTPSTESQETKFELTDYSTDE